MERQNYRLASILHFISLRRRLSCFTINAVTVLSVITVLFFFLSTSHRLQPLLEHTSVINEVVNTSEISSHLGEMSYIYILPSQNERVCRLYTTIAGIGLLFRHRAVFSDVLVLA